MIIDRKENYTVITPEKDCDQLFFSKLKEKIHTFSKEHLIVDFTKLGTIQIDDVLQFLDIANKKREEKMSFIIIAPNVSIDDIPDELSIAPTFNEALDVLEMDAIERDLMDS